MARRIRTIKPDFFLSEDIAALPRDVRLTFIGLWTYVDDYGHENANPALVKAAVWPLDDDITSRDVGDHLSQLEANGQVAFYEVDGRRYLAIVNWSKHQRVDKPSKSNVPAPSWESRETVANPRETVASPRDVPAVEGEGEGKGSGEGGESVASAAAPAPFCSSHPNGTDRPCRACGNARRAREAWEQDSKARNEARTVALPPRTAPDPDNCEHKFLAGYCVHCAKPAPLRAIG